MGFADVRGQRVLLREHRGEEDSATIEPWLDEAVASAAISERVPSPAGVQRHAIVREGHPPGGRFGVLVIERIGETAPIGFLEYQVAGGWLAVGFIALGKPYRGWGYGSEAMRLLEDWAAEQGLA
jgi:RimJ/RimL family protein N-acetyltransferase